jgi:hypothetical protein
MAMLVVLFIVMMISVISAGFIARSDAAMLSGHNYGLRCEADGLAWGGLEHARALVVSPENTVPLAQWSGTAMQLDAGTLLFYDLSIDTLSAGSADPNAPSPYTYSVHCSAYKKKGGSVLNRSTLEATLLFDPNTLHADYISLRRQ